MRKAKMVKAEGRAQCSPNFLLRGRAGADTDVFSLVTVTGLREWPEVSGEV